MNEDMALDHPVIAIDGYSSCGKSTVAKALARQLWHPIHRFRSHVPGRNLLFSEA